MAVEQLGVLIIDLLVHDCDAAAGLLVRDEEILLLSSALPGALTELFLFQIVLMLLVFEDASLDVIDGGMVVRFRRGR